MTLIVAGCAVSGFSALVFTYRVIAGNDSYVESPEIEVAPVNEEEDAIQPVAEDAVTLSGDAKMIYEYVYGGNGRREQITEDIPYFLIGMTEKDIMEVYYGWKVVEFTADSVILEKEIDGAGREHYIIGVKDGYVAVFFDDPQRSENLKEITSTPVSALSADEQIRLREGIIVSGHNNLVKILEDYGS